MITILLDLIKAPSLIRGFELKHAVELCYHETGHDKSFLLAVVIYIALLGWSILNGWIAMSVSHLTKHVLKIAIACSLATQWSFFSLFVYNVLTNGPNELSAILCQSLGKVSMNSASVNDTLQTVFDQGMALGVTTWNSGGLNSVSYYLYAVLIWLGILAVAGVALLEFVVAKFGLALLLVLAPVTCLLILWEGTKGIFESWLRQLLSFALVPLFVTASLMLLLMLLQTALNTCKLPSPKTTTLWYTSLHFC